MCPNNPRQADHPKASSPLLSLLLITDTLRTIGEGSKGVLRFVSDTKETIWDFGPQNFEPEGREFESLRARHKKALF
jgi:hypothetical protein